MPIARVQLPDGSIGRFEVQDGASPSDIEAAAAKQWESMQPPSTHSLGDVAEKVAEKVAPIGTGVLNAGAGLAGLPATVFNLTQQGISKFTGGEPRHLPAEAEDIKNFMGKLFSNIPGYSGVYQPKTTAEKYISAGAEGGASMLGGGTIAKLMGVLSGLSGEAADRYFSGTPGARFGGNLAPLAAWGVTATRTPQLVKSLVAAVNQDRPALEAAAAKQASGDAALGTPTLITNYMKQDTSLPSIVRSVMANMQGKPIRDIVGREEAASLGKTRELAASPTDLPVNTTTQKSVSQAGDAAIQKVVRERSDATNPLYAGAKGDTVQAEDMANALIAARDRLNMTGTGAAGGGVFDNLIKSLTKAGESTDFLTLPSGAVPALNVNQMGRAAVKSGKANIEPGKSAAYLAAGDTLKTKAAEASPALAEANKVYGDMTESLVNPVTQGPIGQSFPKTTGDMPREWNTMSKFVKDPASDPADITNLASHLNQADANAFPLLLKKTFQDAGGTPLEFVRAVRGDAESTNAALSRASFGEKIKQNYLAQGASDTEAAAAAEGANNLLDAVEAVGKAHAKMPGTVETNVGELAGSTRTGALVKFFHPEGAIRTWFGVNKLEDIVRERTMGQIADAFTGPDALPRLIEIAKYDPVANAQKVLATGLVSLEAQNDQAPQPIVGNTPE